MAHEGVRALPENFLMRGMGSEPDKHRITNSAESHWILIFWKLPPALLEGTGSEPSIDNAEIEPFRDLERETRPYARLGLGPYLTAVQLNNMPREI